MKIIRAAAILTVTVPRYEEDTRVAPLNTGNRAQGLGPEAFGAGIGTGLRQVSSDLQTIALEERAKADRTATIDARTKLDQAEVDLLYHPEAGALAKRGKDAFGIGDTTLPMFDDKAAEIESSLSTPEQKQTFKLLANQRRVEVDKQLQRHIQGEMKSYADETNKAALESTLNNVVRFYKDPERLEQEKKFGQALIMSDTDNKGKPPEYIKLRMDSWNSKVHESVIDQLSVDNAVEAQDYFTKNRDQMLPADAAKVEKHLKPLATKQIGMDTALELGLTLGEKPLTEILGEVRTRLKSNPDALNIAETQLKQMESERLFQVKQEAEAAAKPIYKRIAEIQLSGRAAKLSDIPSEEWATLMKKAPEEAGKIQDAIRREIQGEEDRKERKADREERRQDREERKAERGTMTQLLNWSNLNGDPDSLSKANLDALYTQGQLSKEGYKSLSTKQSELRQNPDKGNAIRTEKDIAEDILKGVKLKQGDDNHSLAWNYIENRKKMFTDENKRQPTRKEFEDIVRESVYKVDVAGSVLDKPLYAVTFDKIPKAEKTKIIDAFNRHNRPYTEAEVVRAYGQKLMKGGK